MAKAKESVVRMAGKGAGRPEGGAMRGVFSLKQTKSPMPVPRKASEDNMSSPLQGKDAMKVQKMARKQDAQENLRGMAG